MKTSALILAAGEGTRMKSKYPKVTHTILGKSLVMWAVDAARDAGIEETFVVVGNGADQVEALLPEDAITIDQLERLGTGHAVREALPAIQSVESDNNSLVVLSGDSPLLTAQTIQALVSMREETGAAMTLLTMHLDNPTGYGRIIRENNKADGRVMAIVEEKDCTPEQRQLTEANAGVYCFDLDILAAYIGSLTTGNAQGEYYLTDMLAILRDAGYTISAYMVDDASETLGVNSRSQLAVAAKYLQSRINKEHMDRGVTLIDPESTFIGPEVTIGRDTVVLPGCMLMGETNIGEDCVIGPYTRITDSIVGKSCTIDETIMVESKLSDFVSTGPRAYLRPGTEMHDHSKAGTSVEIKKSVIGAGSKVPHLSYIGDATLGDDVNIGAGTITCNYDGVNKHHTNIGDGTFIGSDTMLVAPLDIGEEVVTGAGSVISKDVPDGYLSLERSEQKFIADYNKRRKS